MSRPTPAPGLDAAFFALADATRRAVIGELLREPLRAGELARRVEMSPPALSRHLRALREAGLVVEEGVEHDARVRVYRLDVDAFASVRRWIEEIEAHWHEQLAAFKAYAETSRSAARQRVGTAAQIGPKRRAGARRKKRPREQ